MGARPGDHKYLFDWVNSLGDEKREVERSSSSGKRVIRRKIQRIRYVNDIPLNDANRDMKVNFLELEEIIERKVEKIEHDNRGMPTISYNWKREKTTKFSWVTDIKLTDGNVFTIMAGGRKRWSIENETFVRHEALDISGVKVPTGKRGPTHSGASLGPMEVTK